MKISLPLPGEVLQRPQINLPTPEIHNNSSVIQLAPAKRAKVSPKKRARNVAGFFERKKGKRHRGIEPLEWGSELEATHGDMSVSETTGTAGTGETLEPPLLTDNLDNNLGAPELYSSNPIANLIAGDGELTDAEDFDLAFAIYLDSLAAHAVSIIQICESLFVVQGWNTRFHWGTVCIYQYLHYTNVLCCTGNLVSFTSQKNRT